MMSPEILVVGAPGYENFPARVIPGLGRIPAVDGRGDLACVADSDGQVYVVPARCIEEPR